MHSIGAEKMKLTDLVILSDIGHGSFGVISKVQHTGTKEHLAMKKIAKEYVSIAV